GMIAAASEGVGMKRLLAGLALVPLLASAAASATFFVEPFGDDANDCSYKAPCASMQHVVDKRCPSTEPCLVQLARGIYHQKVSSSTAAWSASSAIAGTARRSSTTIRP